LLLLIGVAGIYGYMRFSDKASTSLSQSSLVKGSVDQASSLPYVGASVSREGVQGLIFGFIAFIGLVLLLNGLRSGGTKLSVKEIRQLGMGAR
jgi:hypothetical protein